MCTQHVAKVCVLDLDGRFVCICGSPFYFISIGMQASVAAGVLPPFPTKVVVVSSLALEKHKYVRVDGSHCQAHSVSLRPLCVCIQACCFRMLLFLVLPTLPFFDGSIACVADAVLVWARQCVRQCQRVDSTGDSLLFVLPRFVALCC